jgi:hypothetical protein
LEEEMRMEQSRKRNLTALVKSSKFNRVLVADSAGLRDGIIVQIKWK